MDVLILGNSSIVRRRALPGLKLVSEISQIDIASKRNAQAELVPIVQVRNVYDDYAIALKETSATLVYVSLVNSDHERWVEAALRARKHVVVDKPAFLGFSAAERLSTLARRNDLCLAEAVVFLDHPRFRLLETLMKEGTKITRAELAFSFPPLPDDNFRYEPAMGGGALWDLAPYAAASGRFIFARAPRQVVCMKNGDPEHPGVDTAFSVLVDYGEGCRLTGHFGFETEYQNRMSLFGPGFSATMDRVFTPPPDWKAPLSLRRNNKEELLVPPAADCFGLFFQRLTRAIVSKNWEEFAGALLADARTVDQMRMVSGE